LSRLEINRVLENSNTECPLTGECDAIRESETGLIVPMRVLDAILAGSLAQARFLLVLLKVAADREIPPGEPIELSVSAAARLTDLHRTSILRATDEAERAGILDVKRSPSGNTYSFLQRTVD
jgi:hypothetical protein